jgi:predicted glycoside hydrolase/deacetylase ChbG (UPF0249 family)
MADSDRAAAIARERRIDTGLHLNLTTELTAPHVPDVLQNHLDRVSRYLRRRRVAQAIYHPGLANSFEYVTAKQLEEYARLFGSAPERIDGHHHMHLSANVMFASLLPAGTTIRRNFSFQAGEKGAVNRTYRALLDAYIGRRHSLTDYFFSLPPMEPQRLERMATLARTAVVEAETHPVIDAEYEFLSTGEIYRWVDEGSIAPRFVVRRNG